MMLLTLANWMEPVDEAVRLIQLVANQLPQLEEVTRDPQRLHAVIVHLPIALGLVALFGQVLMLLTLGKSRWLRVMTELCYLLAIAGALAAISSGELAAAALEPRGMGSLYGSPLSDMQDHMDLGQWLWLSYSLAATLVLFSGVKRIILRLPILLLSLVVGIGANLHMAVIAHHGGSMVYKHGIGAAKSDLNLTKPPPNTRLRLIPRWNSSSSDDTPAATPAASESPAEGKTPAAPAGSSKPSADKPAATPAKPADKRAEKPAEKPAESSAPEQAKPEPEAPKRGGPQELPPASGGPKLF